MNVVEFQSAFVDQWTKNGRLQAEFRDAAPVELFKQSDSRWHLDMYVSRWHEILRKLHPGANELDNFREKVEAEGQLSGLESLKDDRLLDESDRLAMAAEEAFNWRERFDARIRDLEGVRDRVGVWNEEAEKLLSEFRRHHELFTWLERSLRQWSEDYGREYDRRHPDVDALPFTPIDLGPTNSARLPPVL